MTSSLTLVCFVPGMSFEDTFMVKVDRGDTVYSLKKLIHKERPLFFKEADVSDIKLWKVNIPADDEEALQKSPLENSTFLFPTWKISKAFEEEPRDGCVSVIIKIPGFAGRNIPHPSLKTRREDDDDDAALIKELHPPHKPLQSYTIYDKSSGIAQFWLKLVNAEYDRNTRKLTLAENTSWLGGMGFSTHSLYVREHYEGLWSKICWGMSFNDDDVKNLFVPDDAHQQDLSFFKVDCEEGFRGYIVNGTPGIGKSYFGLYILWRLRCKNDKAVVWYAGHKWFVFNPDGSVFGSLGMPDECCDNLNWLIIDAQTPPLAGARTILLTSPRRERFKEFANLEYVRTVCMPLWDTEEILALRNANFAGLSQNHVLELCKFWGPVPRWILRNAKNTDLHAQQKNLIEGFCKQSLNELVRNMANETYPYGLVSGNVIHMEVNEMYSFHRPRFASTSIANQYFGRQGEERYQQNIQFLKDTAGMPDLAAARGLAFENYAHFRLRNGGDFKVRRIGLDAPEEVVQIPQTTKVHYFCNPSELTHTLDYCQPYAKSYEGIDSLLLPSTLFQITIAKTHSIEVKKLQGLYHITTAPLRLYFVVPEDIFQRNYNTLQPLKQSGRLANLEKTDWRTRIEQWVMCIPFE